MNDNKSTSSSGIGIGGVLLCIFITLKLCHVISWSWWWVLSPVWIVALVAVVLLLVVLIIGLISK